MKKCIDCGKKVSFYAVRCKSCNCKKIWQTSILMQRRSINHPNKLIGRKFPNRQTHLIGTKRPEMQGKLHPRWRNDLIRFCIDCGIALGKFSCYIHAKRCRSCARKYQYKIHPETNPMYGKKGNLSHSWLGGKSYEPYSIEFSNELKEQIRKRDNYTCQNCNMTEEEHLIVHGCVLNIHHIDYNKKNSNEKNLITLCRPCNLKANYNRDYWCQIYHQKIQEQNAKNSSFICR
jgi:hypothetical protein